MQYPVQMEVGKNGVINGTDTEQINLRQLVDNTEHPLWLVSTDLTILECNPAFSTWVSHFIGREAGKGDDVLFQGAYRSYSEKFEMCYKLALAGSNFSTVEDMLINGQLHYTGVTFRPVKDAAGNVQAVSCFARDITEHRKHLFKIEQQNAALREIAYIESHKVRGPVATILGLEQLYNREDPHDPINIIIVNGIRDMGLDLDIIIHQVVRMTNAIGV